MHRFRFKIHGDPLEVGEKFYLAGWRYKVVAIGGTSESGAVDTIVEPASYYQVAKSFVGERVFLWKHRVKRALTS